MKTKTSTFKIIFFVLFLDLIGFSIIFPLFPDLLKHYLHIDGENSILRAILNLSEYFQSLGGVGKIQQAVLFGGIIGSLYSVLQFIFAPIWGNLSDRIGRKPVLMISVFGLFLSYIIWFFSGNFTLLILSRLMGGMMAGNISTASAAIADITDEKTRSKGMAIIGIAFSIGFVIGPALGGVLVQWNLTGLLWGVNPFSVPAGFAAILCLINLFFIYFYFSETLGKTYKRESHRVASIFKLLRRLPYQGVNITNATYFLFLLAFSGMEFTLTFLASERLGFSPMDNGLMFVFIGFVMAVVQGGIVRRKSSQFSEKKMIFTGMILTIPGLFFLAFAKSYIFFWLGLFFLASGSALVIPCLTALVSLYTPGFEQGRVMGVFRSLGALARAIGPFLGAVFYWRFGSHSPYITSALFLLIPLSLAMTFPKVGAKKA